MSFWGVVGICVGVFIVYVLLTAVLLANECVVLQIGGKRYSRNGLKKNSQYRREK